MTEWLTAHHLSGIFIGVCTFLIIGIFHPVVIKCEYYFGVKCWWVFAALGVAMCLVSICVSEAVWSSLAAVTGFSSFWTVKELFDQRERVRKGWYPKNPKRK